ncbi:MAG: hypothetical protein U9N48_03110 [Euryarchaeota archaeon]|nr:hypothetical protein [Euryarchaeota archaeon]
MSEFTREVAGRIFSQELRDSDLTIREHEDQYAPLYLITPTGARCNRVFVVGTLTERDNVGAETDYWRGRIVDPTGSILVYAGQYQPDAAQALAESELPSFVAVVGKPSVYEPEDGTRLISIRVESVQKVDAATRDRWIVDTARRTLERLENFEPSIKEGPDAFSDGKQLMDEPSEEISDAAKAQLYYDTDLVRYRQMVVTALQSLKERPEDVIEGGEEVSDSPGGEGEGYGPEDDSDVFGGRFGGKKTDEDLDFGEEINYKKT